MNRDDIIKMARQACHPHEKAIFASPWGEEWVLRFAEMLKQHLEYDGIHTCHDQCPRPACVAIREAVQREREACAKVCEQAGIEGYGTLAAAAMIRARGEK